ncbi:MAG: hypothetical protein KC476_03740 [Cyanobacteria bacterium HKST-UBA06]|nr:hypothetical protein [Cyanobacteria bacterium HKST-UBA04]MCA9807045.1 hypothetical protein [Cyanobacteria bacterium HKST-UBA06]
MFKIAPTALQRAQLVPRQQATAAKLVPQLVPALTADARLVPSLQGQSLQSQPTRDTFACSTRH